MCGGGCGTGKRVRRGGPRFAPLQQIEARAPALPALPGKHRRLTASRERQILCLERLNFDGLPLKVVVISFQSMPDKFVVDLGTSLSAGSSEFEFRGQKRTGGVGRTKFWYQ